MSIPKFNAPRISHFQEPWTLITCDSSEEARDMAMRRCVAIYDPADWASPLSVQGVAYGGRRSPQSSATSSCMSCGPTSTETVNPSPFPSDTFRAFREVLR